VTVETKGFVWSSSCAALAFVVAMAATPVRAQAPPASGAAFSSPQQRDPLNQSERHAGGGNPRGQDIPAAQLTPGGTGYPLQFDQNLKVAGTANPTNDVAQNKRAPGGAHELVESAKIIAVVGDEMIFLGDIIGQINQVIEAANKEAPEEIKKQQREMMIKTLLPQVIDQKLLYVDIVQGLPKEADINDIKTKIGDQFAISAIPSLMAREKVETVNELDRVLRSYGTSLLQTKNAWIENQFVGYFVKDKVATPEVNREELYKFYQEHLEDYHVLARVKWKQLVVRNANHPSKEAAFDAIVKMGNEIVFGARFEGVAERSSEGFNASKGGVYDWTNQGSLADAAIDKVIFSVQPNALSDIIETRDGYAIVEVIAREPEHYESFEDVQSDIKATILSMKKQKLVQEYVSGLKANIPFSTIYEDKKQSESLQTANPLGTNNSFRSP